MQGVEGGETHVGMGPQQRLGREVGLDRQGKQFQMAGADIPSKVARTLAAACASTRAVRT